MKAGGQVLRTHLSYIMCKDILVFNSENCRYINFIFTFATSRYRMTIMYIQILMTDLHRLPAIENINTNKLVFLRLIPSLVNIKYLELHCKFMPETSKGMQLI